MSAVEGTTPRQKWFDGIVALIPFRAICETLVVTPASHKDLAARFPDLFALIPGGGIKIDEQRLKEVLVVGRYMADHKPRPYHNLRTRRKITPEKRYLDLIAAISAHWGGGVEVRRGWPIFYRPHDCSSASGSSDEAVLRQAQDARTGGGVIPAPGGAAA